MDELEKEWQVADDGFQAGVDFKTWLANQVLTLREAAQQNVQADYAPHTPNCALVKSLVADCNCGAFDEPHSR